jgi:hypothetical protein
MVFIWDVNNEFVFVSRKCAMDYVNLRMKEMGYKEKLIQGHKEKGHFDVYANHDKIDGLPPKFTVRRRFVNGGLQSERFIRMKRKENSIKANEERF